MISVFYVSAAAGAGYTCPTYKEYVSCNPGYVLNGTGPGNECVPAPTCDAGYYLTDAGECDKCPIGYYCADGVKNACPDRFMYYRSDLPDDWGAIERISTIGFLGSGSTGSVDDCSIAVTIQTEYATVYERRPFDSNTKLYDRLYLRRGYAVRPGYYLLKPGSCGTFAYYDAISKCAAGYYCPGKEAVVCNAENKAEVYTSTFGMYPCDAGTYSGPGQSACTVCPDNTWSDGGASECTMCPGIADGYGNRGDVAENHAGPASCVYVKCDAGYYVNDNDECTECPNGYYCINGIKNECPDPKTHARTKFPEDWYNPTIEPSNNYLVNKNSKSISECTTITYFRSERGSFSNRMLYNTETQEYDQTLFASNMWIVPAAGYYLFGQNPRDIRFYTGATECEPGRYCPGRTSFCNDTNECGETYGMYPCPAGTYSDTMGASDCTPCGVGAWAGMGATECNMCPAGLTTIGYGPGADEAGDCGRILNIGDTKIYLRSERRTTPSLNVEIDGQIFYGNMTPDGTQGKLRMSVAGQTYSVYDDSME